ncbi:MAG: PEP/pyruvate-binding domain-containing protein, partial [Anaerolineaceae bacterium]|nr:PEP/pyruvate-binding domain-containing protein [Anaerolineaceae bacterium]
EREPFEAHLREIKVVLIRTMVSDQLRYINIARQWFTISDLAEIRMHKIAPGKIGGKAAGMLLAARILREKGSDSLKESLRMPISFYIGSDLFYTFLAVNNLHHWNDQKYKEEDEMRRDYPRIVEDFVEGEFPPYVLQHFETILSSVGEKPIIVRSSSLLEDNFGTSFAGKYESIFLPNQGTPQENLCALTEAISRIYACTLNPAALLYRRSRGLSDYDERMAILIQVVEGEKTGHYYFPQLAGVAFSHNQYRWSPKIRAEDGFMRLVWGMGTRAVDRVGNDYPRLIALSHPTLRPSSTTKSIRRYSQQYIDLIDLNKNAFVSQPIHKILSNKYIPLRYIAQLDQDGYFSSLRSNMIDGTSKDLILTFEELLRRTSFSDQFRELLHILETEYHSPVDVEFTAKIEETQTQPQIAITLIQCRPQSFLRNEGRVNIPKNLDEQNLVFSSSMMVAGGHLQDINLIVYVPPQAYFSIPTEADRHKLERAIGKLNSKLSGESFICIGPGRWGTSNPDLGVHVDYADIFNCRALIELSGEGIGPAPEPSLGTHFFQDLLEGQIFPLSTHIGEDIFHETLFMSTENHLEDWIFADEQLKTSLRVIKVSDFKEDHHLEIVMEGDSGRALAFLALNRSGMNGTSNL